MLLNDPQHAAKLCQGVTTEILGQDGFSYAPLSPAKLHLFRRYLAGVNSNPDINWDWSTVAQYRSRFEGTVAVNTVYLVPHGTVRLEVLGMQDAPLRGDDLREAQTLITQGMEEWAVGFSTGLSYFPASYSDTDELVELCRIVAARGGVYVVHLRSVFRGEPFDPVEETLEIARQSGVAVHFSHFRTHPATAGRVAELLAPIDAAKAEGLDITLESYPYPSGSSMGVMWLPLWAQEGGPDEILARLADPVRCQRIAAGMEAMVDPSYGVSFDDFVYSHLPSGTNDDLLGLSFVEAATVRGASSASDLLCDVLLAESLEVGYVVAPPQPDVWEVLDRDLMQLFSRTDYTVGSDSIFVGQRPHPRTFGCFPRLLGRLHRRYGHPCLAELINRATALPAARFSLKDRGLLRPGKAADVVIFDPDTLTDTATYEDPKSLPIGIEYVLVNGQVAVENGEATGLLAGRSLP
jgi:N-acyl-D-amino-acid deacylase